MAEKKKPEKGSSAPDPARERFREALEKKKNQQQGGQAHLSNDKHVGPASSNQKATRMYRRKAGGS